MIQSTASAYKSTEYENYILDIGNHLEKMRVSFINIDETIQTEASLLHTMNEKYQKELEQINEKKNILQDTIAQKKRSIAQVQQKLPHKTDIDLTNRVTQEQEKTEKLIQTRQALLAKRNELSKRIYTRKMEEDNKVAIQKENELLNEVELNAYRYALQLEISNVSESIYFEFKCIDKKAPKKIYSIALTISESGEYGIVGCQPESVLPEILKKLEILNQDRELFVFLKTVRRIFQESARS